LLNIEINEYEINIDYFIKSAPYGFLFTSCKTLESERHIATDSASLSNQFLVILKKVSKEMASSPGMKHNFLVLRLSCSLVLSLSGVLFLVGALFPWCCGPVALATQPSSTMLLVYRGQNATALGIKAN